jgi:hypothetical protein
MFDQDAEDLHECSFIRYGLVVASIKGFDQIVNPLDKLDF